MNRKPRHEGILSAKDATASSWKQLLCVFCLASSSTVLAQNNASPNNPQQATITPPSFEELTAEFEAAQQKRMQGAENIVFSQDRSTADVIRSYPFLNVKGVSAVRLARSAGNGTSMPSRANLLLVYSKGPLVPYSNACVLSVCGLEVYADDGTGYQKVLDWKYVGSAIQVSRANGQMELFIEDSGKQNDFVLQGHSSNGSDAGRWRLSFALKMRPSPRDCCGNSNRGQKQ